ncbi:hypothetical protein [Massilia sp. Mn16-1_5]|uniref:hypothetical protein n=1 Tax=Massilia sp. Mn16-1_5 TaxID=2079199 RepID=UPI00109E3F4A|nr:hypothetical protein [Massilia sp. Mn16-1_5]THC44478.1 hypothetical protein C2862_08345 [Massilia sp. Mn16-1_5]
MPTTSSDKFIVSVLLSALTAAGQAQGVDTRWQLYVADLKHEVKVEATVRFVEEPIAESCMGGTWKRVLVEAKTTFDEKFFPLTEPIAYQLENGELTLGRTAVCDGYLLLSGKSDDSTIHGDYDAVSIAAGRKLGYFTLKRLP